MAEIKRQWWLVASVALSDLFQRRYRKGTIALKKLNFTYFWSQSERVLKLYVQVGTAAFCSTVSII